MSMWKYIALTSAALLSANSSGFAQTSLEEISERPWAERIALAESGNALAQYSVGAAYVTGESVELDQTQARKWLSKAAEQDYAEAYTVLAEIELSSDDADLDEAIGFWRKGIALESELSKLNFGQSLIKHEEYGPEALTYLLESQDISVQTPRLKALLSQTFFEVYSYGMAGAERDLTLAVSYGEKCAYGEEALSYCQFLLARYLDNGWADKTDKAEAAKLFLKAAEAGESRSQWFIGMRYLTGENVEKNEETAFHWVEKSAQNGYLSGMISYAVMNALGQGTEINQAKAFEWYEHAAREGSHHALRSLGGMIYDGEGVEQDQSLGIAALLIAAEDDDFAANFLRTLYSDYDESRAEYLDDFKKEINIVHERYGFD